MKRIKKVLFHLNYLYHLPSVEPLLEVFAADKNYDTAIVLALEFEYRFGFFRKRKPDSYLNMFINNSVRIPERDEEFDIVFVTDVIDKTLYPEAQLCMVYHGPTFNKTVTYRELKKHDTDNYLIFAESQYAVDRLRASGSIGNSKTKVVGFPKMDPVINKKYDRSEILSSLDLDVNRKTVLYAPTYKPTSLFDLKDEIFMATPEHNLIIKLHHYFWMGKYAGRGQNRLIKKRISKYRNAVLMPREYYNIIPLFTAADTLVSEASGALTEFLISGKTGIIYNVKKKDLRHSDNQPLLSTEDSFLNSSFITIDSKVELQSAIHKALNPTKDRSERLEQDRNRYFYKCDGQASERIKSVIDNLF